MALLIRSDGAIEDIQSGDPSAGFTLEELQHYVSGFIAADYSLNGRIYFDPREPRAQTLVGGQLLVNEEGLLRESPPNEAASFMVGHQIVGDCVYLTEAELQQSKQALID